MNEPEFENIAKRSILLLLNSLRASDEDLPIKAKHLVAEVVILLNQVAGINGCGNLQLQYQFDFCHKSQNYIKEAP